jgi:hypothetical protein
MLRALACTPTPAPISAFVWEASKIWLGVKIYSSGGSEESTRLDVMSVPSQRDSSSESANACANYRDVQRTRRILSACHGTKLLVTCPTYLFCLGSCLMVSHNMLEARLYAIRSVNQWHSVVSRKRASVKWGLTLVIELQVWRVVPV